MARKKRHAVEPRQATGINRRDLFIHGAAIGALGAAAMAGTGTAHASEGDAASIEWDYEADVVVLGAGSTGLVAAIRARDLGASVIVLEQNFDSGGKLIHSGGWVSLGGGDAIQERDRLGLDPEEMGLAPTSIPPEDLEDDPDRLFTDVTDWSVVDNGGGAPYRFNDREQHRAWADNTVATRQFLMDNYVRFSRTNSTHYGGGMTRARAPWAILRLADVTDIEAGTVSSEDVGSAAEERASPFSPQPNPGVPGATYGAPGWVVGGFTIARGLEYSARKKGVRFMMNRHMDEIIREQPSSGRVLGVRASYTPRYSPDTGERLESYWQDGNIEEREEVIAIRARKAVVVGTGGYMGNVPLRTMFDPRLSEPSFQYSDVLMGPLHADGSGIAAGMSVGAGLAGLMQGLHEPLGSPTVRSLLGSRAVFDSVFPGNPIFAFSRAKGVEIGGPGWEHVIAVNQVGQRFFNESAFPQTTTTAAMYPPGQSGTRNPFTPLDWRNTSVEHIRSTYAKTAGADAALAINEGSRAPDFSSGPIWAIFDQAAVERGGWQIRFPFIADPPDFFFFQADSLEELARLVVQNEYQRMALTHLVDTVARYNGFADSGTDQEFEKPVMHRIEQPPFYAALIPVAVNDSYGGLRINGKAQVVDLRGNVIPGLYSGGEASGGGRQHGIGRATVHGYIAGTNAVQELSG